MVNYQNSKIYTLKSPNCDKYYIGSTTQLLCKRKQKHIDSYQRNLNITSKIIVDAGDCFIQLLESFPCNTKEELLKREGELIRQYKNELVNKNIVGRTQQEYRVDKKQEIKIQRNEHYIENRDEKLQLQKQYQIDNHEKIMDYQKKYKDLNKVKLNEKFNCECGGKYRYDKKPRHFRTQKHIKFIQDFQQQHQ